MKKEKLRTWNCARCGKIGEEKEIKKDSVDTFDEEGNPFHLNIVDEDEPKEGAVFDDLFNEWVLPLCNKCAEEGGLIDSKSEEACNLLENGAELEDKQQYDEAIKIYDKVFELDPSYVEAIFQKAHILEQQGKLEEALKCYDVGIEKNPDFNQLRSERRKLLIRK